VRFIPAPVSRRPGDVNARVIGEIFSCLSKYLDTLIEFIIIKRIYAGADGLVAGMLTQ